MILDMTFLHRRGLWMCTQLPRSSIWNIPLTFKTAFYWAITAAGSTALLVAVPFVVQGTTGNWRTNYWFWCAFSTLSAILAIFLLPETFFPRAPALVDGQLIITDQYGNVTIVPAEASGLAEVQQNLSQNDVSNSKSYIQALSFGKYQEHGFKRFLTTYAEMALSLLNPSVFWALILNTLLFGGLVSQSLTYSTQLESPPWNFSAAAVGTAQAGSFVGALVALGLSGITVDRISEFITRRNDGVREPEHLLPNFFLPACLAFAGLVLYGVVGGNPEKYPGGGWIGIHISFALYYCGFVALSAITGVWIGEATPHWSGAALVLVCGGRNALSFAIRYAALVYRYISASNSYVQQQLPVLDHFPGVSKRVCWARSCSFGGGICGWDSYVLLEQTYAEGLDEEVEIWVKVNSPYSRHFLTWKIALDMYEAVVGVVALFFFFCVLYIFIMLCGSLFFSILNPATKEARVFAVLSERIKAQNIYNLAAP
jgi:hypothetical protein